MKHGKLTLTVEEAAAALGISRNLAYQAARDGHIPVIRIGRRLLVPRRALEKLLEEPNRFQVESSEATEKEVLHEKKDAHG